MRDLGGLPSRIHAQSAIVRAVETGRWLVRVGQAGVTRVIDPKGNMVGDLGLFEPAILEATIKARTEKTLFVRWGNWWLWAVFLVLMSAFYQAVRPSRQPT